MWKEAIITAIVGSTGAGTLYLADTRYVRQDVYQQSVQQRRVWELQDKVDEVKGRADYEGRDLTPYEKQQVQNWEAQIRRMGHGK